jgi:hypothetical protein
VCRGSIVPIRLTIGVAAVQLLPIRLLLVVLHSSPLVRVSLIPRHGREVSIWLGDSSHDLHWVSVLVQHGGWWRSLRGAHWVALHEHLAFELAGRVIHLMRSSSAVAENT